MTTNEELSSITLRLEDRISALERRIEQLEEDLDWHIRHGQYDD